MLPIAGERRSLEVKRGTKRSSVPSPTRVSAGGSKYVHVSDAPRPGIVR
jgi:hypothetical protein